jgi:serine/threonine protein kinase
LDRQVAIKICLLENLANRFRREAQLLASMSSPYIVSVHDFEIAEGGRAVLVMDWIEGDNLDQIIRAARGPIDENRVLRWMTQVCRGMQHAADCGIVHRDLKPSNILIDKKDRARVADFGLARNPESSRLTIGAAAIGTPHYMAPEQAKNSAAVDTRADIYSFGATFYHVLTGRPPFEANTPFAVILKHESEPVVPPSSLMPSLNKRTSEIIEQCLAKSPADRFSRFNEVLDQLLQVLTRDPRLSEDDPERSPVMAAFVTKRDTFLTSREENTELDSFALPAGQIIRIVRGNIIEQQVDAIVSMSDDRLSMSGDASKIIATAGGPDLRQRAKELAPVRPGRAVVTPAATLPSRFVLHGVIFGSRDDSGIRSNSWILPSKELITEVVASCFYEAESHKLASVAFPLSTKGTMGISPQDGLDTLFRAIVRSLSRSAASVREVRIVIYD